MKTAFETAPPIKTLEDVAAVAQEGLAAAQESIEGIVKVGQQQVQKHLEETVIQAKEHISKTQEQITKGYEELNAYSKANVEAIVVSGTILAKGLEDIAKTLVALTRSSFDRYIAVATATLSVKSVTELTSLSSDYAKSSYETLLADTGLIQELVATVANEALAPISARVNQTIEKFAKPLAA